MRRLYAALLALGTLGADAAQPPGPAPAPDASVSAAPPAAVPVPEGGPDSLSSLLQAAPQTTRTKDGIPGDPLNVALVGTRRELVAAFCAAGWVPADPITLRSSVGISVSVLFNVPYPQAPLSNLYLWGRPQDLAFEKPAGRSARMRHHARFWCSGAVGPDGQPLWLGADTFNLRVGRSYTTGRITHHIAPDIDRERDTLLADLYRSGRLEQPFLVPHLGWNTGRNGEGDCYYTDGNMAVGVLRCGDRLHVSPPAPPPDEPCRQP
jgi:hypothetical protein